MSSASASLSTVPIGARRSPKLPHLSCRHGSVRLAREARRAASRRPSMAAEGDVTQFTTVDHTPEASFFIEFMDAGNALPSVTELKARMLVLFGDLTGKVVLDHG